MVIGAPRVLALLLLASFAATATPAAATSAPPPDNARPDAPAPALAPVPAPAPKSSEPQWKVDLRREGLYREGQGLLHEGHAQEALDKLREVNQIRSHPRVLLWIGLAEEQLGRFLQARTTYAKAREDALGAKLKAEEQDAERALAALGPKIPRIVLRLSRSEEVEVSLDAAKVPLQKEGWEINPGRHAVSVSFSGQPPFRTEVVVKEGAVSTIDVKVPDKPEAQPSTVLATRTVIKRAPRGTPNVVIGLWVSGGIAAAAGGTLLAIGLTRNNGGMARGGIALTAVGLGLGVAGLVFQVVIPPDEADDSSEARIPSNLGKRRALSPSVGVQIAPSPAGISAGVVGRF